MAEHNLNHNSETHQTKGHPWTQHETDVHSEKTAGAWEKTKEVSGDVWNRTKEVGGDIWEKTKEVGGDIWEKTKSFAGADDDEIEIDEDVIEEDEFLDDDDLYGEKAGKHAAGYHHRHYKDEDTDYYSN